MSGHLEETRGKPPQIATEDSLMRVRVQTPTRLVIEIVGIRSITCETGMGRRTIEPRRLDGVVALVPGILTLRSSTGDRSETAIDEGILVKSGSEVVVSVRHALTAPTNQPLPAALRQELQEIRDREAELRTAIEELETRFMKQFAEIRHHG